MGLEDGNFGDIDWSQLPQSGEDGNLPSGGFLSQVTDDNLPEGLPSFSSGGSAYADFLRRLRAGGAAQPGANQANRLADLGSTIGAFSAGEKANRFMKGNFTQNYDRNMLEAQKDRNSNESDALAKLAQTSYIMGGGSKFTPPKLTLNGKSYQTADLGFGPPPVSQAEKDGAAALQPQLKTRLMPGGSYTPQPLDSYADPGTAERLSSYGAAGVSGLGSVLDYLSQGGSSGPSGQSGSNAVGSTLSGISKGAGMAGTIGKFAGMFGGSGAANAASAAAIADSGGSMIAGSGMPSALGSTLGAVGKFAGPIAGAALGTYGVAKNGSVGSDTLSGAGAGASIGSMVMPGVGTAVGAGVGALVGALRGAFSVTGKEHAGRDAQAQITQNLSKLATPQQQAEAQKSGWPDPNQALSLIVMRDKLTQSGVPGPQAEAQAESIMHGMWNGEKGGADQVTQAARPIGSMISGFTPSGAGPSNPYGANADAFSRGALRS